MTLNLWDITRSIVLVACVALIWIYGGKFIDTFRSPSSNYTQELLVEIESNRAFIRNLQASNDRANALVAELLLKDNKQSEFIKIIQEDNKKKGAQLEEIGVVVAKLERTVDRLRTEASATKEPPKTGDATEDARRDLLAYEFKKIYGKDAEDNDLLMAWAMYFPNQPPETRWRTGTYPLEFHSVIVESETKQGTFDRAASIHIENNTQAETRGKEFPVKIESIRWEKFERVARFMSWWNPRLGLGANMTMDYVAPKVDFSLSSYGRTDRDMDWRFFIFGVGVHNVSDDWEFNFSFEPFSWNLGNKLPLVENVFIGPSISYDTKFNTSYGLNISIPF